MKLVRLSILEKFRSLSKIQTTNGIEDFTVLFREDEPNKDWEKFHPFCFAGLNGSGKSNVLEALANIFYHLECCSLNIDYSDFLKNDFKPSKSEPIAYELEYYIIPRNSEKQAVSDYVNVLIRKEKDEVPKIKITAQDQETEAIFQELTTSIRVYLPELVIGYSSGENEILSLPFVKSRLLQLDEYFYHLRLQQKGIRNDYDLNTKPESSLVYMDYHLSQAILLANFLLQKPDALKPIKEQLEIDSIHSFRIVINDLELYNKEDDPELGYLLPLVQDTVEKLRKCATTIYKGKYRTNKGNAPETELLDFYVNDKTKDVFEMHFGSPIKLFRAFQVLSFLNMRVVSKELKREVYNSESLYAMYKIPALEEKEHIFHFNIFKLIKNNSSDRMLLKAFSDGEHQFLHTMGICLMLKDKNALFLLDEPETHFNPEWRSKFISLLKESLDKSDTNHLMREIIITSHSPFIISDCYPDKVMVFEKNKQPISANELEIDTFGSSVNILTNKIFKQRNTIGGYALDKVDSFRKRAAKGNENIDILIEEINSELGDSIEKLLLIKEIRDNKVN